MSSPAPVQPSSSASRFTARPSKAIWREMRSTGTPSSSCRRAITRDRTRRYPVVYALHGYSIGAEQWSKEIHVPQTIEGAFAKGAREMIVVMPDSKTVHNGSMYSSSVTTGDFENYVARDVVSYIDAHYRTIASRDSRGLVGHSMGGYGASRIGMKHADVFGSLYIMSPCCLSPRRIRRRSRRSGRQQRGERGGTGGGQNRSGLGEAALRAARAAGVGGGLVAEPEEPAALPRSADRRQRAGGPREVDGQRAARVHRSIRSRAAPVSRDRDRRRRPGRATRRRREVARRARSVRASRTRSRSTPAHTPATSPFVFRST